MTRLVCQHLQINYKQNLLRNYLCPQRILGFHPISNTLDINFHELAGQLEFEAWNSHIRFWWWSDHGSSNFSQTRVAIQYCVLSIFAKSFAERDMIFPNVVKLHCLCTVCLHLTNEVQNCYAKY